MNKENQTIIKYIKILEDRVNFWRQKLIGSSLLASSYYGTLINQTLKIIEANKKILNNH